MKISGGIAKGRKINTKGFLGKKGGKEYRLRPTSTKVREALFNILRDKINGAVFIDLYAGTGTVGFEALSRGARKSIFVENDTERANIISKIAANLGFSEKCTIIKNNAENFLLEIDSNKDSFDIIFIDPPYHSNIIDNILNIITEKDVINKNGIVIFEHFKKRFLPERIGKLRLKKTYRYGDTMLTFYEKGDA
jgi:16S rRNA (guanine(966)-N(2))-methyltransferase RsmD